MTMRTALALCCLVSLPAAAQRLDLPAKSPGAMVKQTVGMTDITVEYSSPSVRGRKIWGGLQKYGEVWRAGANKSTDITFSKDVIVGDTPVPAGTYAFFVIPMENKPWTLILSKDNKQPGAFGYKKENDLVRIDVKPTAIPNREHLAYLIENFTDDNASIDLEWEKVRIGLPVKLKTKDQALANIKDAADNQWATLNNAARYFYDNKDYAKASEFVDKSIAMKETWYNDWTKAQVLAATNKYKEAYPLAQKAQDLGSKEGDNFFLADDVKKALTDWKSKS